MKLFYLLNGKWCINVSYGQINILPMELNIGTFIVHKYIKEKANNNLILIQRYLL